MAAAPNTRPLVARLSALRSSWRTEVSAPLLAIALVLPLTDFTLRSPLLMATWGCLGLGVILAEKTTGPTVVFGALVFLAASALLAIPASLIFGDGHVVQTAILAMFLVPLLGFYLVSSSRVLDWVAPAFLVQAGWVLYQGLALRELRVSGFGGANPNPGAAFLVLGVAYFLTGRHKWLALPLLAALPFTGSRWACIVAVVVVAGLAARGLSSRRLTMAAGAIAAAVMIVGWSQVSEGFSAERWTGMNGDLRERLPVIRVPAIWPQGFTDDGYPHQTPHNVPLRLSIELGLLAGLAWVGVTAYGLWGRPRLDAGWWMLMSWALLSMLYYFPVLLVGGFWWLLIGVRTRLRAAPASQPARSQIARPEADSERRSLVGPPRAAASPGPGPSRTRRAGRLASFPTEGAQ